VGHFSRGLMGGAKDDRRKDKKRDKDKSSSSRDKARSSSSKSKSRRQSEDESQGAEEHQRSASSLPPSDPQRPATSDVPQRADPSGDFEAGRVFERSHGTVPADDFQRIWRAARGAAGAYGQHASLSSSPEGAMDHPPLHPHQPRDLPIPVEYDASRRFDRYDRHRDGFLGRLDFESLVSEWQREQPGVVRQLGIQTILDADRLFGLYDGDRDGRLHRSEFLTMLRVETQRDDRKADHHRFNGSAQLQRHTSPLRTHAEYSDRLGGTKGFAYPASTIPSPADVLAAAASATGGAPHADSQAGLPSPYSYFDETVSLPLTSEGAANARAAGHTVSTLSEAYRARLSKLQDKMATGLMTKREQLRAGVEAVHSRMEEVKGARLAIERETSVDFEAIIERLRSVETVRLSGLEQHASQFESEIDSIDRLSAHIDVDTSPSAMLSLVQRFPELIRSMERLMQRRMPMLPEEIARGKEAAAGAVDKGEDVDLLSDFPRELKDRLDAVAREPRYAEIISVKDRMLYEMLQERLALQAKVDEEKNLSQEYSEELAHWLELTDRLTREVNQLRSVASNAQALREEHRELRLAHEADQDEIRFLRAQNEKFIDEYATMRHQYELLRKLALGEEEKSGEEENADEDKDDGGSSRLASSHGDSKGADMKEGKPHRARSSRRKI